MMPPYHRQVQDFPLKGAQREKDMGEGKDKEEGKNKKKEKRRSITRRKATRRT